MHGATIKIKIGNEFMKRKTRNIYICFALNNFLVAFLCGLS